MKNIQNTKTPADKVSLDFFLCHPSSLDTETEAACSFSYKNLCECYKKLTSRSWPKLFTLTYYFFYIHFPFLLENKKIVVLAVFLCKLVLDHRPPYNDIYYKTILM